MPLVMPATPGFRRSRFGLQSNTQTFRSPLTNDVQRLRLPGARWMATYTLPQMNRQQAAAWQAFLLGLEGGVNTFYAFDPDKRAPRGIATGTPLVKGAGQTGSTLVIDGCTPNVNGWLLAGDMFAVNGELKMLTAPVNTNGSGEATLSFKAALRTSPADNAPLSLQSPSCLMVLTDDQQTFWEANHNGIYQEHSFSATEVFA